MRNFGSSIDPFAARDPAESSASSKPNDGDDADDVVVELPTDHGTESAALSPVESAEANRSIENVSYGGRTTPATGLTAPARRSPVDLRDEDRERDGEDEHDEPTGIPRRGFLVRTSQVAMVGGLLASYGGFAGILGRFLYPTGMRRSWVFVAPIASVDKDESIEIVAPSGTKIVVMRQGDPSILGAAASEPYPTDGDDAAKSAWDAEAEAAESEANSAAAAQFITLTNKCPHLGCIVHWQPANQEFFCPCHNGRFNAAGEGIEGPPTGQSLRQDYPLKVNKGLLYIEVPEDPLS